MGGSWEGKADFAIGKVQLAREFGLPSVVARCQGLLPSACQYVAEDLDSYQNPIEN